MVFEKKAKNGKKIFNPHYFLFYVIFSKSLKQKCLIPTELCFLDGKKPNIAKLVDINQKLPNPQFLLFGTTWSGKIYHFFWNV